MTFTPRLFIGIGATNAMYTLRETYLHEFYSGGKRYTEVRSFHHYNLGQDADEAFAKAKLASENMALPLSTTQEQLDAELRDIKRATPSELAERQRIAEEQQKRWDAEEEERRIAREAYYREELAEGLVPFGRYRGTHLDGIPASYAKWLVDNIDEFEGILKEVAQAVAARWTEKLEKLFPAYTNEYIGEVGDKIESEVTVVNVREFNGYYGITKLVTMIDEAKRNLTTFASGKFYPEIGSTIKVRGTIKAHNEYNGIYQTMLTRVKEI